MSDGNYIETASDTFQPKRREVELRLVPIGFAILMVLGGNRLSLSDEQTIQATVGRLRQARPLDVFIYACIFVVVLELAGAAALFPLMARADPLGDIWQILLQAAFLSGSAFCNAGVSIYPDHLDHWREHAAILMVISIMLFFTGRRENLNHFELEYGEQADSPPK